MWKSLASSQGGGDPFLRDAGGNGGIRQKFLEPLWCPVALNYNKTSQMYLSLLFLFGFVNVVRSCHLYKNLLAMKDKIKCL